MKSSTLDHKSSTLKNLNNQHWNGEKYHKNSDQQKIVADLLMAQFAFKESDRILDVGCGDGKITYENSLKAVLGNVVGIDPSESMINFAKSKFVRNNLSFQIGKASQLSFSKEFDVITSFSSLHWEPNQKEALLCFKEALVPGGTILLAIPGPDMILRSALKEVCNTPYWFSYFKDYQSPGKIWTANEYAKLLLETDFIIKKIEVVKRYYYVENSAYKGLLDGMLPHLSQLEEKYHSKFIDEVTNLVLRENSVDDHGRMKFEVKVLEIIAETPII